MQLEYLHIIFILSFGAILMSYLFYPILCIAVAKVIKKKNYAAYHPSVTIVCAAYNESGIIRAKLDSLLRSNYDRSKLEILIGDDGSTDGTAKIIDDVQKLFDHVKLVPFNGRNGKPKIIETLTAQAKGEIIISTDANIIFDKDTIKLLVAPFQDEKIGLVDTIIKSNETNKEGIAKQEQSYIGLEADLKHAEGNVFGAMMGPFGACFAIRKSLYKPLPANFLVDDFHICMNILKDGYKAISIKEAIVFEEVATELKEEIRRKTRIATGNIQNLFFFKSLWLNPFSKTFIPFVFHKVLRWFGPIFLILALISNCLLYLQLPSDTMIRILLICQLLLYIGSLFDLILQKIGIHTVFLRYISHFLGMNWALLLGFIRYFKGVKTNVWEPTKRNQ